MKIIEKPGELKCFDYPIYGRYASNRHGFQNMVDAFLEHYHTIRCKPKYINFIVTGSSGAYLAGVITTLLEQQRDEVDFQASIYTTYIDKDGEKGSSHRDNSYKTRKYGRDIMNIFLDDFVATGNTMQRVFNEFDNKIDGILTSWRFFVHFLDKLKPKHRKQLKFIICESYDI